MTESFIVFTASGMVKEVRYVRRVRRVIRRPRSKKDDSLIYMV